MNEKSYLSDLDKTVLDGIELGVFKDYVGQRFLNLYHKGILDSFIIHNIEERVRKTQRRIAFSGCPLRVPQLHSGDYTFGYDIYKRKIRVWRQYSNAGTLIVANTGAGKSNLSGYRAVEIIPNSSVRGAFLIDVRKKEYRKLRPIFLQFGIDLKIVRGRRLKINPLEVPYAVEPIGYTAPIADSLVKALNLPPRASTLLRSTIIKLYEKHGVLNGSDAYPTLFHLHAAIKADRQANPQARQAILDNLEAVLLSLGPEVLAYHKGWSVHELAQQYLAIELGEFSIADRDVILASLLTAEFSSRIAQGISNPGLDCYIAFDEGQRLFSQSKETAAYEGSGLIDLAGLVRGTGIGLEVSVLTTQNLSHTLPNLLSTKIVGRCGSIADYTAAGSFMGLNAEQATWAAHHMVPGMFLGQIGDGQYRYPFIFNVPLIDSLIKTDVSNEDADRTLEGMRISKVLPASGI